VNRVKTHLSGIPYILSIALVLLGMAACGIGMPVPAETLPTVAAPATSVVNPTLTPIMATSTPSLSPNLAPQTSTPQPKPSPTPLVLRNIPIEGGEPENMFYAMLVYPDELVFTTRLWFRVYAHKPLESKVDGEGIERVDFTILNSDGNEVYFRQEETAGYCAFSGGEPDCVILDFAEQQYIWPDGGKMVSGTYTLNVVVTATDQTVMFSDTPFTIRVP
jgi:hypothetical protein